MKKNEHTCRWRVDFKELAYEGGGSSSWTQYYRTKVGALLSKVWNLYVASWGGKATLIDTCGDEVPPPLTFDEVRGHTGAGWQKDVAPPESDSRPTGLPPKR